MSIDFENTIIEELEKLDYNKFKVNITKHHIFVCGGEVNAKASVPPSFRDRFVSYTISKEQEIYEAIVLAEEFKDYFKENTYKDLLVFEDEIANISTLVIIFLESPGSLVELGMFCSKPNFYKKLVIVAPQKEIEAEDSFIYLGPLEYIRKKEKTSVVIYPWPDKRKTNYDRDHLIDLCEIINGKLSGLKKSINFKSENTGHVAFLVFEIIRLCYPILLGEIEIALMTLNLEVSNSEIKRHLYLLSKLRLIAINQYSGYHYYYPLISDLKSINFGRSSDDKVIDYQKIQMSINKSYILSDDQQSRKRRAAKKQINEKLEGESQ